MKKSSDAMEIGSDVMDGDSDPVPLIPLIIGSTFTKRSFGNRVIREFQIQGLPTPRQQGKLYNAGWRTVKTTYINGDPIFTYRKVLTGG